MQLHRQHPRRTLLALLNLKILMMRVSEGVLMQEQLGRLSKKGGP